MPKPLWVEIEEDSAARKKAAAEAAEKKRLAELKARNRRPDGGILSPVPGIGIGTPWGKKPNDNTYWQARGHHTGADYPGFDGYDVVAVRSGTVRHYEDRELGHIQLLYADNGCTYWYCHLSSRIADGSRVKAGQKIGEVGHSGAGAKFGPHLHLEKRKGHSTSWAGTDLNPTW